MLNFTSFANNINIGIFFFGILLLLISVAGKSYIFLIMGILLLFIESSFIGLGFSSILLIIGLGLITARFVRKRKQQVKYQESIYQSGREQAQRDKVFNKGYRDEY